MQKAIVCRTVASYNNKTEPSPILPTREEPVQLPAFLTQPQDSEIRLMDHRIGLYHLIQHYNEGESAEMLACRYPTVPLALVHKVLAFYLENQVGAGRLRCGLDGDDRRRAAGRTADRLGRSPPPTGQPAATRIGSSGPLADGTGILARRALARSALASGPSAQPARRRLARRGTWEEKRPFPPTRAPTRRA
jgi:hypothetical protein